MSPRHPIHEARRRTAAARHASLVVLLAVAAAPVLGSMVAILALAVRP